MSKIPASSISPAASDYASLGERLRSRARGQGAEPAKADEARAVFSAKGLEMARAGDGAARPAAGAAAGAARPAQADAQGGGARAEFSAQALRKSAERSEAASAPARGAGPAGAFESLRAALSQSAAGAARPAAAARGAGSSERAPEAAAEAPARREERRPGGVAGAYHDAFEAPSAQGAKKGGLFDSLG